MPDEQISPTTELSPDEKRFSQSEIEGIIKNRVKETQAQLEKERAEKEALRKELESKSSSQGGMQQGGIPDAEWERILEEEVERRAEAKAETKATEKLEKKSVEDKVKSFGEEFDSAAKQDNELLELSQKGNKLPQEALVEIAKMDYIPNKIAVLKDLLKDKASADILLSSSTAAEFKKNIKEISERLAKINPGPSKYQSADKLSPTVSGAPDDEIDFVSRAKKKGM